LSENSSLSPSEYGLILLAISAAKHHGGIREVALAELQSASDVTPEIVVEATESAGIMGQLNTYYKFKKFIKDSNPAVEADYGPAKLRMQSLANPKMGKERFEMLSFAVSLVNGCEQCVVSHEEALRKLGVSADKIHDIVRLTASTFGAVSLLA
jgi:alkyl hydroperoxide reductase subunit D